ELGNAMPAGAEHLYRVPPLQLPDADQLPDLEALSKIDSVKLLFERLRDPDSLRLTAANARDVARLCRGLDGVPLALELVAAQIDMRSLAWVLDRWNQLLDFAGGTLRKSISVSTGLLSKEPNGERLCRLFHGLSVFHRGWLAEAAHAVCG